MDSVVVPVSGGGMLSGICIAVKAIKPDIKIYAAEPLNADDCAKSFAAGRRIPLQGHFLPFLLLDLATNYRVRMTYPISLKSSSTLPRQHELHSLVDFVNLQSSA